MSATQLLQIQSPPQTQGLTQYSFEKQSSLSRKIEISNSIVQLDAGHMHGQTRRFAVELIAKSIFVAHLMEKDELLITSVMPWIDDFCGRTCSAIEAEPWFNAIVEDACELLEWQRPVIRLTRREDALQLRCYLGETKPSDFRFLDNWYCEARESFQPA